jgi:hypothetical protein
MVKRRGDKSPEPPGGRAAERLRMYRDAREPDTNESSRKTTPKETKTPPNDTGEHREDKTRRKDK